MLHRTSTPKTTLALGAAAFLLALAGCAPQVPQESASPVPQETITQAPTETVSPVCAAADALEDSVDEFRDTLVPDSTLEQVGMARDKVVAAYDALAREARVVAQERADELKTQVELLHKAVDEVPDGASVSDAIDSLRDEADAVETSLSSFESELTC